MKRRSQTLRVRVDLPGRPYDVRVGSSILSEMPGWLKSRKNKKAFIISDQSLTAARQKLKSSLKKSGWEITEIPVQAGESFKDWQKIYPVYGELLRAKAGRDATIFALGGGSIGDAAGFIASTYLRGVDWVGLPTTLLAQVDSSVGGKTAVNHALGKNLIGTFHQPKLVVCETDFLKTLSSREMISGWGEMIKYGLVFDSRFFKSLRDSFTDNAWLFPAHLRKSIQTSLKWKAHVVAQDEFDRKGLREVLNFGHTFGHALEAETGYLEFQHGEAVLWGMRFALALSQVRGHLSAHLRSDLDSVLAQAPIPRLPSQFTGRDFFQHMSQDKKVRNGRLHFVLLKSLGKPISDSKVTEADLHAAFALLKAARG
jgi:3-dehydroquinate synthase